MRSEFYLRRGKMHIPRFWTKLCKIWFGIRDIGWYLNTITLSQMVEILYDPIVERFTGYLQVVEIFSSVVYFCEIVRIGRKGQSQSTQKSMQVKFFVHWTVPILVVAPRLYTGLGYLSLSLSLRWYMNHIAGTRL